MGASLQAKQQASVSLPNVPYLGVRAATRLQTRGEEGHAFLSFRVDARKKADRAMQAITEFCTSQGKLRTCHQRPHCTTLIVSI